MSDETKYVYGYGRTKHIMDEAKSNGGSSYRDSWGLCGAPGGYPFDEPDRPVCKLCVKAEAKRTPIPPASGRSL